MVAAVPGRAQQEGAPAPRVSLRLTRDTLTYRSHAALEPGGWLGVRTTPGLVADEWQRETLRQVDLARWGRLSAGFLADLSLLVEQPADTTGRRRIAIPQPGDIAAGQEGPGTFAALGRYADLGIDLRARLEVRFDRLRNANCTAADVGNAGVGCEGGFPTPTLDEQFRVLAGGIVSQRFHINVDFDTEREFSVNNNINVWYQGLEDEILRRVEVGNVTFRTPPSRFVTAAIPANSFGIMADAQMGPVEFTGIYAQQKGSAVRTRTFMVGDVTTQPVSFLARDLDFQQRKFFFVVSPFDIPGYPAIDVLNINREVIPLEHRPTAVRIYRLRAQASNQTANANLGGVDAIALRLDSPQQVGPFSWELLVEGRDYYLDKSGLWFGMSSQLGTDDFMAVSYTTAAGDTVGTFPSVNGTGDTLMLIFEPRQSTAQPTFFHEMRNVYRVGGTGVDRTTVDLTILVNDSERPLDGSGTYLSLLGLSTVVDPSTIDEFNRVFPRPRDPNNGLPLRNYYVVFPHVTPFADSTILAPGDLNDSLYKTPTYLIRTEGPPPKYSLELGYEASGAGDRSTLNLGALQIRDRSEKIFIGTRQLERGLDYDIDYTIGQVFFLNPDSLFTGPTEVSAQFEENQLFDTAPRSIFGFAATYNLSRDSRFHAVGMFQRDRTQFTRPQLGFEPQAGFIGGVMADLLFRPQGLTELLNALPLIETDVASRLDIDAEAAVSDPNPNRTGTAYLEDFQGVSSLPVRLTERDFQLGSAPVSGQGLPPQYLNAGQFSPTDVVPMVWQNVLRTGSGTLEFEPREIDSSIVLVGAGVAAEPVLWLTLFPDTVGGAPDPNTGEPRWFLPHTAGPRWRSITQPFGFGSGVGVDLSRVEFLEFWVLEDAEFTARQQSAALVFDFGTVQEDAPGTAPDSLFVSNGDTTFSGFRFVGTDGLDTERDSVTNTYNATVDDIGILGDLLDSIVDGNTGEVIEDFPMCDLSGVAGLSAFPLGDLEAICTRRNSRLSTEDLNGDNRLDKDLGVLEEDVFRYVFPLGDDRYYVRDGVTHQDGLGRPLTWRLYRIPFRVDSSEVGTPNIRQVQALRTTLVSPDQGSAEAEKEFYVVLARMRLVGAPWLKRSETPILGVGGGDVQFDGLVRVAVASTEDQQLGYEPPPGTTDLPEQTSQAFETGVTQVNETSLRVLGFGLEERERAEAFIRYTAEGDKNFLLYKTLRVWARGRGNGWGPNGDLEFFIKAGYDVDNYYLYHSPAVTDSWEPEVLIDIPTWLLLRTQIEERWLTGEPPGGAAACGLGDTTAYVACDSTGRYLVQVKNPGVTPPSLARVSEVATGIFRVADNMAVDTAELWVDDIRLSDVVDDAGYAAAIDVRLSGADVFEFDFGYTMRDDLFRQLDQRPTYVTDVATRIGGMFRFDKLLPEAWGLTIPINLRYTKTDQDPFFLRNTDILADALTNLRQPRSSSTTWDILLRRSKRGARLWERALLDPVVLQVRGDNATSVTSLNSAETRNRQYRMGYAHSPGAKTVAGAPRFLVNFVNSLPAFISESEFGRSLRESRLRWNPFQLNFASLLTNNVTKRVTFRVPVNLPTDVDRVPLPSIVNTWRNQAGINLQPYSSLALRINWVSTRDLQDYGDTTAVGRLLRQDSREFLGMDVGFERQRQLTTALNIAPPLSSWLRPRLVLATNFLFSRDPNQQVPVRTDGESEGAFKVAETLTNSRRAELGATLDVARLWQNITGDSGFVAGVLRGLLPADFTWERQLRSSYDRAPFSAGLGYRLALGGLEDFRVQEGTPATAAGETYLTNITAGTRLPLGGQLRVNFRKQTNTGWSRRGDAQNRVTDENREWPSFSLSWVYSPTWIPVSAISGQFQYREVKTSTVQPAALEGAGGTTGSGAVTLGNRSKSVAPSLSVSLPFGMTISGTYSNARSESETSGNLTKSDRQEWGANTNFAFQLPGLLFRLPNRIQTTVGYNSSILSVCILRTGENDCVVVSDSRREQFDVRMTSGISSALRGGLTFSYVVNDQRHTSQKITQIVFSIYGEVNFRAGQLR
jgi:hypothetical protein